MVMNMPGFYLAIAFGFILFYMALVLVIFTYAVVNWLASTEIKNPVVSRSLEKISTWLG
jgi:hypothetical protein